MDYTGIVKKSVPTEFAIFQVLEQTNQLLVEISLGGQVVIRFPMKKGIDQNEIGVRISTVISQTGFIDGEITVVFD